MAAQQPPPQLGDGIPRPQGKSCRFQVVKPTFVRRPLRIIIYSGIWLAQRRTQMTHRHQRGWLKKEKRSQGETWVLFFRTVRKSDGKRVEKKIPIGLVQDFSSKSCAWTEVERQQLHINQVDFRGCITFADLAHHYAEHELVEPTESIHPKAHTTIRGYERVLRNRLLPQWGNRVALGLEPLEVEEWLKALKRKEGLANPTLDKMRRVMSLVYRHSQRYGLIPRNQESNPLRFVRCKTTSEYEAMILTPEQAYAVLLNLGEPERTLTLLAAGTGLRISECLGLQWQDVSFAEAVIQVRRTWTCGKVGWPKSKASKGPVPLHPLLAEFMFRWKCKTPYSQPGDWVFPSLKLKGRQPRVANMLVEDYLRPAAVKVGVLSSHRDDEGGLVDDDPRRFGFHNLRHSLASFLVRIRTDPKTVQ
ncbi:MAG: tyrosine-type recombinase/integrase, partial [Candidatus Sulfotelmatobacter sp.]